MWGPRHVLSAIFLVLICAIYNVKSQSCREYSETCIDDKSCCGGCCLDGICRDTYKDCRSMNDPCMEHYCPPDEECYIYQAENCGGCGPAVDCRSVPPPPTERMPKNISGLHNNSVSNYGTAFYVIISLLSTLLFF